MMEVSLHVMSMQHLHLAVTSLSMLELKQRDHWVTCGNTNQVCVYVHVCMFMYKSDYADVTCSKIKLRVYKNLHVPSTFHLYHFVLVTVAKQVLFGQVPSHTHITGNLAM